MAISHARGPSRRSPHRSCTRFAFAATLCGEHGIYRNAQEQFGRLGRDAFLSCRLVVDTGMNALGWTLERARAYMRKHAFMNEAEVATESIRYSSDLPAQSLAYKLGDTFLIEQRAAMQAALGPRFDLRDFHAAVLANGSIPLPLVAEEVARATAARAG